MPQLCANEKMSVSNIILWILFLWMRLKGRICILCLRICVASPRYTPLSCPYLTKWRVTDEASIWGVFHAFSSNSLNIILLLQFILILLLIWNKPLNGVCFGSFETASCWYFIWIALSDLTAYLACIVYPTNSFIIVKCKILQSFQSST